MKKLLFFAFATAMMLSGAIVFTGCKDGYDDRDIRKEITELEGRVNSLENLVAALNAAQDEGLSVTSYTTLPDSAGWKLTFSDGSAIEVMHGQNGKDGVDGKNGTSGDQGGKGDKGDSLIESITESDDNRSITIELTNGKAFTFQKGAAVASIAIVKMVDNFENESFPGERFVIEEGNAGQLIFRINPSNTTAFAPTDISAWRLDQTSTRADYVNEPDNFELISIAKDGDLEGQYIATIKCIIHAPAITDYAMALVLNTGTDADLALVSSPTFILGTAARTPKTYTPPTWDDVQSIVDGMFDGDILDLSGLTPFPDNNPASTVTKTITVSEDITITAQMDPVYGKFGDGTEYEPFYNVNFVLAGNPTVTFRHVEFNFSVNKSPLISGEGNVIVDESQIIHAASPQGVIHVDGDVTVRGTIATLRGGNLNHTSFVGTSGIDIDGTTPAASIHARNVTIEGGSVAGCSTTGQAANGSAAIEASGDVKITGGFVIIDGNPTDKAVVLGGVAYTKGNGGNAIEAAGKVTIDGGVNVAGGDGIGEGSIGGNGIFAIGGVEISGEYKQFNESYMPSARITGGKGTNGGNGGTGIDAAGGIDITGGVYVNGGKGSGGAYSTGGYGIVATDCDVTLKGERHDLNSAGDWWFSLKVRSGQGDYVTGVPFKFQGDPGIVRTLTANTAQISDVQWITYTAPWAMELLDNDQAILDDCRLGWYNETPLFSGGYYRVTNLFLDNTWGTNANGTPLDGNEWNP